MLYEICAITDIGCVRPKNEDGYFAGSNYAYGIGHISSYEKKGSPFIALLMDGVGGCEHGEAAVEQGVEYIKTVDVPITKTDLEIVLDDLNKQLYYTANTIDTATTIAGIMISDEKIVFNVGDSKVFSINQGYLEQLSVDDTISGISGEFTDIGSEPLLQYMGKKCIAPHYVDCKKNTAWLMCTDGLTNMVEEKEIYRVVKENPEIAPKVLVDLANNAGGYDNITVVTIK